MAKMVGWLDFGIGLLTDVIGAVIISVPIYILFTRRERQKERALQKNVFIRIQDSFKSFKTTSIYNLRNAF